MESGGSVDVLAVGAGAARVTGIRIVTPYRPFAPESAQHRALPTFDWIDALRMVTHTAAWANHCPVHVLTDLQTELPVPCLRYPATSSRLTLWLLEVRLQYLESDDFDRDTVLVDADELIFGDLRTEDAKADLTVLIRSDPKHATPEGWPLLNGVQWWARHAKKRLVRFYRDAFARAMALPEDRLVWGAETDAVRALLEPLQVGLHRRAGLRVRMREAEDVLETFSTAHVEALAAGTFTWPKRPILDFRWMRKAYQRAAYEATALAGAAV